MEPGGMGSGSPSPPQHGRHLPQLPQQLAQNHYISAPHDRSDRLVHDPLLSDEHPGENMACGSPDDVVPSTQQHANITPPSPPRIAERISPERRAPPPVPGREFSPVGAGVMFPHPEYAAASTSSFGNPYDDSDLVHAPPPVQPHGFFRPSYGSTAPLVPPHGTPPVPIFTAARSEPSISNGSHSSHDRYFNDGGQYYSDNPYNRYSTALDPRWVSEMGHPSEIVDDGDDGLEYAPANRNSRSVLSLGRSSNHGSGTPRGTAAGAAAGAAGGMALGNLFKGRGSREVVADQYGPLPQSTEGLVSNAAGPAEIEWAEKQGRSHNKKLGKIVGFGLAIVVILAIVLGVTLGVLRPWEKDMSNSTKADNKPPLTQQDPAVQAVLNNKNLHKVFPGMDYTPLNAAQYQWCGNQPANQNNVTLDVAVLSQLTNRIRLYGTDCNQTELVLEAIKTLKLSTTDMKVWMGVWQDTNSTTNERQLTQMYQILDKYGTDYIAGIIIGNEILFRGDLTAQQLINTITEVRNNLTAKSINLPLAASELGDSWQKYPTLASAVDVAMANVHPFFGGVQVEQAAAWTYNFWQNSVVAATKAQAKPPTNIIGEVGWPSQGGSDGGSTAGLSQLQRFLDDFVCAELTKGTEFFWFSAFDEPWKIMFDKGDQQWEDHWGLLDVNRKIKPNITIPSCGGTTVT